MGDSALNQRDSAITGATAPKPGASIGALSLLAAAAFVIGALSILAANWARFSDLVQLLAVLAVFNATLLTAGFLLQRGAHLTGHACALAAAAMSGGAMILIGQSFNIQGALEGLLFLWLLSAGVVTVALGSGPALAFTLALIGGWMTVRLNMEPWQIGILTPPERGRPLADPGFWLALWLGAGAGALAWRWRAGVAWHAAMILFWVWVTAGLADLASGEAQIFISAETSRIGLWLVICSLAAGALAFVLRQRGMWGAPGALGYAAAAALTGAFQFAAGLGGPALYYAFAAFLAGAAGLILLGGAARHRWLMILGVIAFLGGSAFLYLRYEGSLLYAGAVLMAAAAFLIGLIWLSARLTRGGEGA